MWYTYYNCPANRAKAKEGNAMQSTKQAERCHIHIAPKRGWFDIDLRELWNYRDLIFLFAKRNFIIIYKQTILGPAWIILQPLMTTLIFTLVFGNEQTGLPAEFAKMGQSVMIPQSDEIDSLNLAVAVSVGSYVFMHGGNKNECK